MQYLDQEAKLSSSSSSSSSSSRKRKRDNQYTRWAFTLNNPSGLIPFDDPEHSHVFRYWIYQGEVSHSGTYHFQGYFEVYKEVRLSQLTKLPLLRRCHLGPARRNAQANKLYCSKQDTRVDGPWEGGVPVIQGRTPALAQAAEAVLRGEYKAADYPTVHVCHYRGLADLGEQVRQSSAKRPRFNFHDYPWQSEIRMLINGEPDDRRVVWVYSEEGNVGKTSFANRLRWDNPTKTCVCTTTCYADVARLYNYESLVIFDLARSLEHQEKLNYSTFEALKDGRMTSTKYEPITKWFDVPHVLIFANFAPLQERLSADRWIIYEVTKDAFQLKE